MADTRIKKPEKNGMARLNRLIAARNDECARACRGIPDPAATIRALRTALEFYATNSPHSDTAKADDGERARAALALLPKDD